LRLKYRLPLLCILIAVSSSASNQDRLLYLVGNIYDADSLDRISFISISINSETHYLSDKNGHFELSARSNDTVIFRSTGYESSVLPLSNTKLAGDTLYLDILMKLKPFDIPEATIKPFTDYNQFRTALINMDTDNSFSNPIINMSQKMGEKALGMDAYSNYRNIMFLKDPNNNALIFLSTKPEKGLVGALNAIGIRMPWQKR
jgi:hypothetical protein